ncbi:MAG: hypothetical protein K0S79_95 [Nitrospira sp.]|jgi:hypothetical protein|nr:hypothetical protein [Nitrospira sp.]
MYNDIEAAHGLLMDGGIPGAYNNVLWTPPLLGESVMPCALDIAWAQLQYRGAGTPEVGIGGRLHSDYWRAYTMTGAAVLADDTVDAQDAGANDFPMEVLNDDNSGFLIASPYKFNCLDILAGATVSVGGAPVRILEYSGPAGWVTLSNPLVGPVTGGHYVAGETLVFWTAPQNHQPMTVALHGTGVPEGWYGVRVKATTAPTTTAGLATSISVAIVKAWKDIPATAGIYTLAPSATPLHIDAPCDALVGVCSVAHDANQWSALVKVRG